MSPNAANGSNGGANDQHHSQQYYSQIDRYTDRQPPWRRRQRRRWWRRYWVVWCLCVATVGSFSASRQLTTTTEVLTRTPTHRNITSNYSSVFSNHVFL